MRAVFSFPNPVNEISARVVAGGVLLMAVSAIAFRQPWLLAVLAYGFLARVATGPTLSPLGQLVTKGITPRLPVAPRYVPGPPKRFAQGVGAVVTVSAVVLHYGFDLTTAASGLAAVIVVFAALESLLGFCAGCAVFGLLMRAGVIPERICAECADVRLRETAVT